MKTIGQLERDSLKTTFYEFIDNNKSKFTNPINNGHTTTYKSLGGSILLSIDDTHPSHSKGMSGYSQKATIKNTVRIKILNSIVKSSFLGFKKYEVVETTYKINNIIDENLLIHSSDIELYKNLCTLKSRYSELFEKLKNQNENDLKELRDNKTKVYMTNKLREEKRLDELIKKKETLFNKLDKDTNGIIDVIQSDDFDVLLKKLEKGILEIDKDYLQKFVKLSNYLKSKKTNLQETFEIINKIQTVKELVLYTKILNNNIHTYNSLVFHSISMVVSLTKNEMIVFFEIYEKFDELNVFDSKHERDMVKGITNVNLQLNVVSSELANIGQQLSKISEQLYNLMYQLKESNERILDSIDHLTYTTSSSIGELGDTIQNELNSIGSSISFNNLLTGIQSYQLYKINMNIKSLGK